jgi:hypothetical protein
MCTVTREEFETHRVQVLMDAGQAGSLDEAQRMVDREYPKSTDWAIDELQFRGLDATPWVIEGYCRRAEYAPPVVGGSRVWTKATIDRLAEAMERDDRLTVGATYRKEFGLSWREEQDMLFRERARREAEHAGDR